MNPILSILSFTKQFWKWYLGLGAFVITISLLSLVTPLLSKQIVDIIVAQFSVGNQPLERIVLLLGAILLTDVISTVLTAWSQWRGDIFGEKLQTHLSSTFYKHVLSLHVGYFDNEITGKISNKMTRGIASITDFIHNMINNFLPFFLTAFVTIILLAQYSLVIAVLLAVLFPLYIVISHRSTLLWGEYSAKENAIKDQAHGRVFESLTGIRVVKAFTATAQELQSFRTARHKVEDLARQKTRIWHWYDFLRRLALNIILFGIFSYIVYWTYVGRYTIGEMTLLLQLVNQARFPLFAMSFILGQIQQASSGSKDFFDVLHTPSSVTDAPDAKTLEWKGTKAPAIRFSSVSFAYEQGKHVLQDVSFTVAERTLCALVGESGQGKSTLVNLLLRFYTPAQGTIEIKGHDITQVTQASLHEHVAVVFQESLLFSGTIYENILYGRPSATRDEVIAAATAANADVFIRDLPDGYESVVGERGVKLSGGQKQRIAIARAMLKDAPLIILDEATSALDSKSELLVQQGLDRLLAGRTAIVIAHRLSTIAHADQIVVIADGTIAEQGTAKELLRKKNGLYAGLVALQASLLHAPNERQAQKLKAFDLVG